MSSATSIEWTDATWNPVRGCSRVSQGCVNCYAEAVAARFSGPGMPYDGLAKMTDAGPRWTGKVALVEKHLADPPRWKKPRRIFVNSMSDLFHEGLSVLDIGRVFNVMGNAPQHTFQVLTKRPERMNKFTEQYYRTLGLAVLPNVWLGVSVEDQATADERIPLLLQTPAAVRFVSYEPALGPVEFDLDLITRDSFKHHRDCPNYCDFACGGFEIDGGLDWIIVGGESGPRARPFDVAWARSTINQCKAAGVACFVKQLGRRVRDRNDAGFMGDGDDAWDLLRHGIEPKHDPDGYRDGYQGAPVEFTLRDKKGGDWSEWPEDLRVREFPS